ncbi:MAG: hypothetical protein RL295_1191 [Pseudomonadota bacterium]|jgi:hypothetical protein
MTLRHAIAPMFLQFLNRHEARLVDRAADDQNLLDKVIYEFIRILFWAQIWSLHWPAENFSVFKCKEIKEV